VLISLLVLAAWMKLLDYTKVFPGLYRLIIMVEMVTARPDRLARPRHASPAAGAAGR
jgi:hypothetical protein